MAFVACMLFVATTTVVQTGSKKDATERHNKSKTKYTTTSVNIRTLPDLDMPNFHVSWTELFHLPFPCSYLFQLPISTFSIAVNMSFRT